MLLLCGLGSWRNFLAASGAEHWQQKQENLATALRKKRATAASVMLVSQMLDSSLASIFRATAA